LKLYFNDHTIINEEAYSLRRIKIPAAFSLCPVSAWSHDHENL